LYRDGGGRVSREGISLSLLQTAALAPANEPIQPIAGVISIAERRTRIKGFNQAVRKPEPR